MTKSENLNLAYNQPRHYAVCPTVWLSGLQTNKSDVGDIVFSEEWGEIKKQKQIANSICDLYLGSLFKYSLCGNTRDKPDTPLSRLTVIITLSISNIASFLFALWCMFILFYLHRMDSLFAWLSFGESSRCLIVHLWWRYCAALVIEWKTLVS